MYTTHRTVGLVIPVAVRHVIQKLPVAAWGGGREVGTVRRRPLGDRRVVTARFHRADHRAFARRRKRLGLLARGLFHRADHRAFARRRKRLGLLARGRGVRWLSTRCLRARCMSRPARGWLDRPRRHWVVPSLAAAGGGPGARRKQGAGLRAQRLPKQWRSCRRCRLCGRERTGTRIKRGVGCRA